MRPERLPAWRGARYAASAIAAIVAVFADVAGFTTGIAAAKTLTACSGLLAWIRMPSHNMRPARP